MLAEELTQGSLNKLYRNSKQSYLLFCMYQRKHKPKGQQPVDVKKLEKRKMEYNKRILHQDNQLSNIRKMRFKDIIHWNGGKPSITGFNGFYGWLWWFCGDKNGGRGNWYHREAVQPMRDMVKMIPYDQFEYCNLIFNNIDGETLVLVKKSSKRSDYIDEKQWKDIVDFIREHNTKELIKKIFFCVYDNDNPVKIREKEWKFIENAGCECVGDRYSYMGEDTEKRLKGKLFIIKK